MTHLPRLRLAAASALLLLGLAATAAALLHSTSAGAQSTGKVDLPDLVQVAPYGVAVEKHGRGTHTRWRLIFGSAVQVPQGLGPMIVVGHRTSRRVEFLTVDQYIDVIDPNTNEVLSQQVVRNVGRMHYITNPDHEHFHYLGFDRYELRKATTNQRVSHDRKTGFCLGDRYLISQGPPGASVHGSRRTISVRASVITPQQLSDNCNSAKPNSLTVKEGITPGNGDNYKPSLEGQYLDITSVPAGRYWLVHRANSDHKLREVTFANDVSSSLIRISRSGTGRPSVRVLKSCEGTARCQ